MIRLPVCISVLFVACAAFSQQPDSTAVTSLMDTFLKEQKVNSSEQDSLLDKAVELSLRIKRIDYAVRLLQFHGFLKLQQNEVRAAEKLARQAVTLAIQDAGLRSSVTCTDAIVNLTSTLFNLGQPDSSIVWAMRGKKIARGKDLFNYSILLTFEALAKSSKSAPRRLVAALYDSATVLARETSSLHDDVMAGFNQALFLLSGTPEECGSGIELLTSFNDRVNSPELMRPNTAPYNRMMFTYRNPRNTLYALLAATYLSLSEKDISAMYMQRVVANYRSELNPYLHYTMFDLAAIELLRHNGSRAKSLYDSAVLVLKKQEGRDSITYASYLFLKGQWAEQDSNYPLAVYYYRAAANSGNSLFSAFCLPAFLRALVVTGDPEAAELIKIVSGNNYFFNQFLRVEFLRELAQYYRSRGDTDRYNTTIIDHYRLKDSLATAARYYSIREVESRFQALEKDKELQERSADLERQRRQTTALIAGVSLLLILLVAIAWLYRDKRKRARQLAEKNARVELLIRELHHRVKNNMQTISSLMNLQAFRVKDEQARLALREGQERVEAMALIHQKLYLDDNLRTVNMEEYIRLLTETLAQSYGVDPNAVSHSVVLNRQNLDVDAAIPVALIVNELMINAFKYAFPQTDNPRLTVALRQVNREVTLQVNDNGPGIEHVDPKTAESFGLRLVHTLARQLKATYQVENRSGAFFTLTFMIPA